MNPIVLPVFDPFIFQFGNFGIRWYAAAYVVGFLAGFYILRRVARKPGSPVSENGISDLMTYLVIGVLLGGRLGFALFYHPGFYLSNPLEILKIWQGGMSFHGGLIGSGVAMLMVARKEGVGFLTIADRAAMVLPIGLFFGRISNFINGELWGRVTDVPWAMVFPASFGEPRHPSQLYEALLEGLLLGLVMIYGYRRGWLEKPGYMTATLCIGYGIARFLVEFVREPDPQLGILFAGLTMGQLLCIPMIAWGIWLVRRAQA